MNTSNGTRVFLRRARIVLENMRPDKLGGQGGKSSNKPVF